MAAPTLRDMETTGASVVVTNLRRPLILNMAGRRVNGTQATLMFTRSGLLKSPRALYHHNYSTGTSMARHRSGGRWAPNRPPSARSDGY